MFSLSAKSFVSRALGKINPGKAAIRPSHVICGSRGVACFGRGFTKGSVLRISSKNPGDPPLESSIPVGWGMTCKCGCSGLHTEADRELVTFLEEEITAEESTQKPVESKLLDGFELKTDGAEIELRKKAQDETIVIKLNVNHSVDAEEPESTGGKQEEQLEMRSKPNFTIEIEKKDLVISFHCSFTGGNLMNDDEGYDDAFHITELSVYKGDWKDSNYVVSGDIMDGHLYDLLMNMLDERGISNEFVDKMENFCTAYEHKQYIKLLKDLKTAFTK